MTGILPLDWALVAVSVFNTILLFSLGLTVLLNAERRSWAVWMMGVGLMLGAAFFIGHTAILGHELVLEQGTFGLEFWWRVDWIPVIISPYAWYVVVLWYAGFWNSPQNALRHRHRIGFSLVSAVAFFLAFIVIYGNPFPTYMDTIYLDFSGTPAIGGVPLLFILFPPLMITCILLSMDALRRPEPAHRLMGDLARQRSRPWLMATAATLLVVSLLVTGFIALVFAFSGNTILVSFIVVVLFDLILETLLAIAIILLGQAVVAYEVFTGKTLPRRGFARQWRNTLLIGAGCAGLMSWNLLAPLRPIYSQLLMVLLMVGFYALYNWRSFVEREKFMAQLRPFVSSPQAFEHLMTPQNGSTSRPETLFQTICRDVLGAKNAYLLPVGSFAPLAGSALVYPPAQNVPSMPLPAPLPESPDTAIVALPVETYPELRWAIPLWAERGRIGVLLLGEKADGGLYTQEEIEIARSGGERIIDALASDQMARRLMELQRGRLAESRVMDRRTRRILHDETLPTLHTSLLSLSRLAHNEPALKEAIQSLTVAHQQIADLIYSARQSVDPAASWNIAEALQKMVRNEFEDEFSSVNWTIADGLPALDAITYEVVTGAAREVIRNAALHGRGDQPERPLNLMISVGCEPGITITVSDDGVGFGYAAVNQTGSGNGLALHTTMLAIVGGYLVAEPGAKGGTTVTISLTGSHVQPTLPTKEGASQNAL